MLGKFQMLIRYYIPKYKLHGKRKNTSIDAFWIECTQNEAKEKVFLHLSHKLQLQAQNFGEEGKEIAREDSHSPRSFCFLVTKDLSSIQPFWTHYPFGNLWNGYSPFISLPPQEIQLLEEVLSIVISK